MTDATRIVENYYANVIANRFDDVIGMFSGEPSIDTPLQGSMRGREPFAAYLQKERAWLIERQPGAEVLSTVTTDSLIVAEYVIFLSRDGAQIELPVAAVAVREGARVSTVRVYHTTWTISGMHTIRDPLIRPATVQLPAIVDRYMDALAKGDQEALLLLFTEDAYVREPSGSKYRHEGPEGRRRFYRAALAAGGISLQHCTAAFDGRLCAVEYVCDRWGGTDLDPQPGVAIYEIDPSGLISAVRIYDDVRQPGSLS